MDPFTLFFKGVIDNAEKISIVVVCVVVIGFLFWYMNKDRTSRDKEAEQESKKSAQDHTERTQLTGILANQLAMQKEMIESMNQQGGAIIDMRKEMAVVLQKQTEDITGNFKKMLDDQNASFIRQLKSTLGGGVRMQLGIMQLNSSGKIILANEDAMALLGITDKALVLNRQLYNLGLRVMDIEGRTIEDSSGLPFAGVLKSGKVDTNNTDAALLGIQLPDMSYRWLFLNMSPVFDGNNNVVQILLTFYDAGKLVVLERLSTTEDITDHGFNFQTSGGGSLPQGTDTGAKSSD